MRPLCARKGWRRQGKAGLRVTTVQHISPLMAQELDAGASIPSATPIVPEERGRADHERVEQHTDLARLFGGTTLPLTWLTQRAGAATADTGRIHHPQTSIS